MARVRSYRDLRHSRVIPMFESEEKLSVSKARHLFPESPGPDTVLRWILTGLKVPRGGRVKLEAMRSGGKWFTSREAISRFLASQNEGPEPRARIRTPTERQAASEAAERELIAAGA